MPPGNQSQNRTNCTRKKLYQLLQKPCKSYQTTKKIYPHYLNMSSLIQWNCNGFYKHNTDINRIKYEQNPDIICLQETNFKNLHIGNINGYSGYKKNRPDALRASGGVATYIKNNINSKEIYVNSNLEVIAVQVILKTTITICSIYIPDSTPLSLLDLNSIITQLPKPFLTLSDFNSRNI
jgi:hypothetical protein